MIHTRLTSTNLGARALRDVRPIAGLTLAKVDQTRFVSSGCEQFLVQATVSVGDCGRVLVVVRMMVTSLGSPVGVLGIAVMSPASSAARAALMRLVSYCFQVPSSTLCGV